MFNRMSLLFAIALVSALLLAGPPAALGQATGVNACSDAWDDSSASGSCDSPTFTWYGNNLGSKCEIETECNTGNWNLGSYPLVQEKKAASITTSMENVDRLVNCSGNLYIGNC